MYLWNVGVGYMYVVCSVVRSPEEGYRMCNVEGRIAAVWEGGYMTRSQ